MRLTGGIVQNLICIPMLEAADGKPVEFNGFQDLGWAATVLKFFSHR